MARILEDWLSTYVAYASKTTEPPMAYHWWVGVSILAGALQRRVYFQAGFDTLYPNLYIILVGPSGTARKGTACSIGLDLLRQMSRIRVVADSLTKQALIQTMVNSLDSYVDPMSGKTIFQSPVTIYSEELAVFLGENDNDFLVTLTNWFDSRDVWKYETKTAGKDHVKGVCVNLLGATAPDWMKTMFPKAAIGGGFTSRVIFVVEEGAEKIVADGRLTIEQEQWQEYLINDLEKVCMLTGEFLMTENAMDRYQAWYVETRKSSPVISSPYFNGYCARRATLVRKLSMVMSASRGDDHMIKTVDFDRALQLLEAAEVKMPRAFSGLGDARYAEATERILDLLVKHGKMRRSTILRTLFPDVDDYVCSVAVSTLCAMGVVRIHTVSEDPIYEWTGVGV